MLPVERNTEEYDPTQFLRPKTVSLHTSRRVLIILNQPIPGVQLLSRLWEHADAVICADGGANRLLELVDNDTATESDEFLPHEIIGDLDSLLPSVKEHYQQRSVCIKHIADQESTDFGKAMKRAREEFAELPGAQNDILIIGSLSGRVDQGLGLVHEMLREQTSSGVAKLWLFSESSVSFFLKSGSNGIRLPVEAGSITPNVGIIPVGGPSSITTKGLKWDVHDWETSMGGRVSTSNHIVDDMVTVHTTVPVLFTVERRL